MRNTACDALAEYRSAFVDGALADAERERVLSHLTDCAPCRHEVEELRSVRQLLNQAGSSAVDPSATYDFSRLVSIAGGDAYSPVWSRPFRRTRAGALPSARRIAKIRAAAAVLALGTALTTLGAVGYLAAPPIADTAILDPSDRVRSEFASALSQFPLTSRSVDAVLTAPQTELVGEGDRQPALPEPGAAERRIAPSAAAKVLTRAANESNQVSYSGVQSVFADWGEQTVSAKVTVKFDAGHGVEVDVFSPKGNRVDQGYLHARSSSRMVDTQWISVLSGHYALSGSTGSTVAGRRATTVEAVSTRASEVNGPVVARWWIDDLTGLILRQESYDPAGNVVLASGFTALTVGPTFIEHFPPRMASSTTTSSLTLSRTADLIRNGWYCQRELAGLSLVRLRSDQVTDPAALHMVYSDGVSTVSVFEQRGKLAGAPDGATWDHALAAHVRPGMPRLATWQSGDTVFTVATDGSAELLSQAVAALPHQEPLTRTTMERIRAGWVRILDSVIG